ncbi:hypothetical protein [Actinoallomurus sp. CA-150999]|uniref:hypothetical protein n=1 Tax=Actinoallomurus sp. CA-150999 TaxID=3239887 RepID=UPI003D8C61A8
MTKRVISIEIDVAGLEGYSDAFLVTCWHVAQANPQDGFATETPGELAERIGREIIRRWLATVQPELWHHQGRHYYWRELTKLARYQPSDPEWTNGTWVPRALDETPEAAGGAS